MRMCMITLRDEILMLLAILFELNSLRSILFFFDIKFKHFIFFFKLIFDFEISFMFVCIS